MPEVTICFDLTEHCLNIPLCPPIPLYPVLIKKREAALLDNLSFIYIVTSPYKMSPT